MEKRRLLALILAALITAASVVSCSENQTEESENQTSSAEESGMESVSESAAAEDTGTHYYDEIEDEDFDGWTVNCAGGYGELGDMDGVCEYFTIEDITGDEFNDALYNRILAVGDKFNVDVVTHDLRDIPSSVKRSVTSGTRDYQLCAEVYDDLPALITGNYSIPITSLPNVDIEMPYWDEGAKEVLMINGIMYYVLSDISFSHYDSTAVLFYNGVILDEYQVESPYDLYVGGQWTMDNMYSICETVSSDTNGDGVMTYGEDLYGVVGRDLRYQPQLSASGVDVMKWSEEEGTYNICYTDETVIAIGEMTRKMLLESNFADMIGDDPTNVFKKGNALFNSQLLGTFKGLRDLEDDYGIIPWPSIEENMEIRAYCRNPTALLVCSGQGDTELEMLGTVMSALAAYGHDYIIGNYITRTVIGKGARDPQSADVIRSILDKRMYDVTYSMGLGTAAGGWYKALKNSSYASQERVLTKTFKSLVRTALEPYEG